MYSIFYQLLDLSTKIYDERSADHYDQLMALESEMDALEILSRHNHFTRMSKGECGAIAGSVYCDILAVLERMGDHACNIAKAVVRAIEASEKENRYI